MWTNRISARHLFIFSTDYKKNDTKRTKNDVKEVCDDVTDKFGIIL